MTVPPATKEYKCHKFVQQITSPLRYVHVEPQTAPHVAAFILASQSLSATLLVELLPEGHRSVSNVRTPRELGRFHPASSPDQQTERTSPCKERRINIL